METNDFDKFLLWERTTHDVIDFKKIYVDMCGDILAGLMLSEIVYWYLPSKTGDERMKVVREGVRWITCARAEWWDRTRMSKRQADRAMKVLEDAGLIKRKAFMFNHQRMMHLRIDRETFLKKWHELVEQPLENPYKSASSLTSNETVTPSNQSVTPSNETVTSKSPIGDFQVTKSGTPITESTSETTTKNTQRVSIAAIEKHTIWQAFIAGYPDTKPRIDARSLVSTQNAITILQKGIADGDYTLNDITETVRWQLGKARKQKYFITYVDADIPDYKAFRLASSAKSTHNAPTSDPYVSPGVDMNAIVAQLARDGDNDPSWTPQREASGAWKPQPKHAKTGSST